MITTKEPSSIVKELRIIKAEIRRLIDDNKFTTLRLRNLEDKLKDESALIREQNLELKDEILGEIQAMRDELAVNLAQYTRREEILENHEERLKKLEKPLPTP